MMAAARRERSRAEISFHVGLAAILLPVVTLPVLWGVAIHNVRFRRSDPIQQRWARRLVGLAIVDTFVAFALVLASVAGMQEAMVGAQADEAKIGVLVDEEGPGVLVREVFDGSPAAEAGVAPGDPILQADGRAVDDARELIEALSAEERITLQVEREDELREVAVAPRVDLAPPTVVRAAERCEPPLGARASGPSWELIPYGLFLALALGLAILGHRRGVRQWTFWGPFVAVLVLAALVGSVGTWLGCSLAGGAGTRASAVGLTVSEIALTAVALGWWLLARRRIPELDDDRERWPVSRTYPVGLGYAVAWMPRVAILSVPLLYAASELGAFEVSPMFEDLLGSAADPWTAGLVFLSAVILAPIAEEVLFRGLLLPHLARSVSSWTAIYVGALLFGLLHVSHGVMFIGPLVLGALLGWARLRSRGLTAPILLHMTFNGFATISSWLS